jgi:zinc transporter ZupT
MLEDAPIGRAFGRSRSLVTGAWWRVFGIQLLTGLIAVVVTLIVTLPFGGLTQSTSATYLALSTIGAIIAATITEPLAAGVTVLIYTDQRIRRERMDLELAGLA